MDVVKRLREWATRAKPVATKLAPLAFRALWDVSMLVMMIQDNNMVDPAIKLPRQTERATRSVRELWEAVVAAWKQRKDGPADDQQEPPRHQD